MSASRRMKQAPILARLRKEEEVTVVGRFMKWPSIRDEIEALEHGRWHPTSVDFLAVANTPNQIRGKLTDVVDLSLPENEGTVAEFVGALQYMRVGGRDVERPDHVVRRLNLISHGTPGVIALAGTVYPDGRVNLGGTSGEKFGDGTPKRQLDHQIDEETWWWFNETDVGRTYRDMVRSKLHKDAQIWLILCRGGGGRGGDVGEGTNLATQLATTFGVVVMAYTQEIWYRPHYDPRAERIFSRTTTSIGEFGKPGTGYYSMVEVFEDKERKKRLGAHLQAATPFSPLPKPQ